MQAAQFGHDLGSKFDVLPKDLDHQLMLRVLFYVHFACTSFVLLVEWTPKGAVALYNGFLLALLLGLLISNHLNFAITIEKCMFIEAADVVFDVLIIALYYNKSTKEGLDFAGFVFTLIQVLSRFGGLLAFHRIRKDRRQGITGGDPMIAAQPQASHSEYQSVPSSAINEHYSGGGYDQAAPKTLGGGFPDYSQQQYRYQ